MDAAEPVLTCNEMLTLRAPRLTDAQALAKHANSREIWINLRDRMPHPYSLGDANAWLQSVEHEDPRVSFVMDLDGEAVGGIGLILGTDIERCSAEVGYWVGAEYWGRGIATPALGRICRYAFENLGLLRVFATLIAWNPASSSSRKGRFSARGHDARRVHQGREGDGYVTVREGARIMNRLLAAIVVASMPALAAWLPRVGQGFDPQTHGQAAWSGKYDYFICVRNPIPAATPFANFDFAVRGCPEVLTATAFVYGSTEPIKGHALYDSAHKLALYQEGCCAWRNAVLASGIGPPPTRVGNADLSAVRTQRGITLGMTQAQIVAIYGKTTPHAVPGAAGVKMLSYTTMHGNPSSAENACGQFQNFAFRNNKLYYIELLAGC